MPPEFVRYGESFGRHHWGWKFKHWDESNLPPLRNQKWFDEATSYAQKADIARYEILHQVGGIYVDTDVECLKSFDPLLVEGGTCFCANEAPRRMAVSNAVIGAIAGHPFLDALIRQIPFSIEAYPSRGPNWQTGPEMLTWVLAERQKQGIDDVVVFPGELFYPHHWVPHFGPNVRQRPTYRSQAFPNAYAVHHWAADWREPAPKSR
jgi:inositol phosphorylceramide mannosyltransferase catalytic subunit